MILALLACADPNTLDSGNIGGEALTYFIFDYECATERESQNTGNLPDFDPVFAVHYRHLLGVDGNGDGEPDGPEVWTQEALTGFTPGTGVAFDCETYEIGGRVVYGY